MFLCLAPISHVPLEFLERPDASQLSRGAEIQRSGSGPDRTLLGDRRVSATWFDGRIHKPSDTVTWVSPSLTARWLGYLSTQDGWTDEELAKRWNLAETTLHGRLTFVVRLSEIPKADPLDFDPGPPTLEQDLANPRFQLRWQSSQDAPGKPYVRSGESWASTSLGLKTAEIESYDSTAILDRQFFELTPLAPLFLDDSLTNEPVDGIKLGDRYGAVYVVSFPIDPAMSSADGFEFDVIRKGRTEKVYFKTTKPHPGPPKGLPQQ